MKRATLCLCALALAVSSCGGGTASTGNSRTGGPRSRAMAGTSPGQQNDRGRCDANAPNREVSEYDTSGDDRPDVRKVFLQVGQSPMVRLVLICREADLNGDGTKDVVRYYNDEGRPLREEADRDFDGQMDQVTYFEDGRIVRTEVDSNRDGRVDTKVFYEGGRAIRTERDMAGHSTPQNWHPDRWEYLEDGRMVRMGSDIDGDGRVDRWDRDQAHTTAVQDVGVAPDDGEGGGETEATDAGVGGDAGPPDAGPRRR